MAQIEPIGLELLVTAEVLENPALAGHYRVDAVRAHLLEMASDLHAARGASPI